MKTQFCILGLLVAMGIGRAQNSPALERLPFQRWVAIKSAAGMETSFDPPKKNAIADKWSLSEQNITTQISEVYRYKDNIVVFGWSGNTVGVVTVIDASTGRETLQLLVKERDRFITSNGMLLYSHWFVKEAYDPDDSVWFLDLNYPLPAPVSQLPNGIVVEIGTEIYPRSNDKQVRHSVRDLLIGANGQELFFTDWPVTETSPAQICFVRVDSIQSPKTKTSRNCVDGRILTGYPLSDIKTSRLDFDQSGALRFSVTLHEPGANEHFVVDPLTLATSKSSDKASGSEMDNEGTPPLARAVRSKIVPSS